MAAQLTRGLQQGRAAGLRAWDSSCEAASRVLIYKRLGVGAEGAPPEKSGGRAGAGSGPAPVCVAEAHRAAKVSLGKGREARGTALPPSAGRSQPLAGGTHVWRRAERRPTRLTTRSNAMQATEASPGKGRATQGGGALAQPLPVGRGLVLSGSPLVWVPAPAPACADNGATGGEGAAEQRAERRSGGRSPSLPGIARIGPGAHSCAVRPSADRRSRGRARRRRRRQVRAERRRPGVVTDSDRAVTDSDLDPVLSLTRILTRCCH